MPLWLNERSYTPAPPSNGTLPELILSPQSTHLDDIATIPLASFIASFVASMAFKQSARFIGHKIGYLLGSIISFCGCAWVLIAASPTSSYELYIIAVLFGAGSSITMIASLCITAELIGPHADQGGLIYSAVTFCDKLITGITIVIIETM
jgi:Na+/melibiose symporter-like transporter